MKFHDEQQYVTDQLRREHDPSLGVFGLPVDAKSALVSIAYYYQMFAVLISFEIFDEDRMIELLRIRSISVWVAIEPYVMAERERTTVTAPAFLALLEEFVDKAKDKTSQSVQDAFTLKNEAADRARLASRGNTDGNEHDDTTSE